MKKKIYLSSTFIDLEEHRAAVKTALERAQFDIECMEKYPAFDERPKDKCLLDVAECDYYVLALALRYGFQPKEENPKKLSITQMEYLEAIRLKKPCLAFLFYEKHPWPALYIDSNALTTRSKIGKFRQLVGDKQGIRKFTTPDSLAKAVLEALSKEELQGKPKAALANTQVRQAYLDWLQKSCESVELLGLDLRESQNVRLGQVYVPAVTTPKAEKSEKAKPEALREERHALLLHRLGEESLYLPGAPGAGKTTFCRWLALVVATGAVPDHAIGVAGEFEEKLPGELRGRFPLLCRLREWAGHEDCLRGNGHWTRAELEQSLAAWITKAQPGGLTWAAFHEELQAGRALLILDGVDEVAESSPQGHLPRRNLVTGLADALPEWLKLGNRVLLTSRPYGLCNDDRRKINLCMAELLELPEALQDTFVRRWYAAADPPNAEEKSGGLLVHLQEREDLAELRRNPMLLTALCVMYDQGKRLPQDFYRLYDAVVGQVLYKRYLTENERDRARYRLEAVALGMHLGRHSGMDRRNPDFRDATDTSHPRSPSSVAANRNDGSCLDSSALRDTPAAEVDMDEIHCHLVAYKRDDAATEGGAMDAAQAREDLLSNSGLLLPRSDGRAAFYHLSFQEFLAAVRLKRIGMSVAEVLVDHATIPAWRRTLTFLFCTIADKDSPKAALDALGHLLPKLEPGLLEQDPNPALLLADCLEVAHGRGWNLERFAKPLRQACDHALLHLNPPERAHLWRALGRLGLDDRPGVGVVYPAGADSFAENQGRNQPGKSPQPPFAKGGQGGFLAGVSGEPAGRMPLPDIDWVEIPEGPFLYGEKKTKITLPAFKIARYPITNSQFQCFIDDGGYEDDRWWAGLAGPNKNPLPLGEGRVRAKRGRWNGPNQPRETVSWYEGVAYTRWLTAKLRKLGLLPEGMTVLLPTEAEWEKAARGTGGREYPWGGRILVRPSQHQRDLGQFGDVESRANHRRRDLSAGGLAVWCA